MQSQFSRPLRGEQTAGETSHSYEPQTLHLHVANISRKLQPPLNRRSHRPLTHAGALTVTRHKLDAAHQQSASVRWASVGLLVVEE